MRNIRIPQVFTLIRFYVDPFYFVKKNKIIYIKIKKTPRSGSLPNALYLCF